MGRGDNNPTAQGCAAPIRGNMHFSGHIPERTLPSHLKNDNMYTCHRRQGDSAKLCLQDADGLCLRKAEGGESCGPTWILCRLAQWSLRSEKKIQRSHWAQKVRQGLPPSPSHPSSLPNLGEPVRCSSHVQADLLTQIPKVPFTSSHTTRRTCSLGNQRIVSSINQFI